MKRLTKIAAVAVVAAISIGCISAFSAENLWERRGMKFPAATQEGKEHPQFGKRPEKVELTEEEKAAKMEEFKADLAAKLAEGKITQEQYDGMIAKIEEGKFFGFGKDFKKGPGRNFGKGNMPQRPERVELTEEEKAAKTEEMKARWAKMLEEGKITQEQYDEKIAAAQEGKCGFGFGGNFGRNNAPKMKRNFGAQKESVQ